MNRLIFLPSKKKWPVWANSISVIFTEGVRPFEYNETVRKEIFFIPRNESIINNKLDNDYKIRLEKYLNEHNDDRKSITIITFDRSARGRYSDFILIPTLSIFHFSFLSESETAIDLRIARFGFGINIRKTKIPNTDFNLTQPAASQVKS